MSNYIKKVFYEDDDCTVTLEELDGHLFVHVAVYEFNKAVLKKLKELWADIKNRAYMSGYDNIHTYTKDMRIVKFFKGFVKLGEFDLPTGKFEVVQWELN